MYEFNFQGRKPTNAQVLKKINEGINQGNDYLEISWGENMITVDRQLVNGKRPIWYGSGWIRNISGYELAEGINKAQAQKFVDNHFQFIAIR